MCCVSEALIISLFKCVNIKKEKKNVFSSWFPMEKVRLVDLETFGIFHLHLLIIGC